MTLARLGKTKRFFLMVFITIGLIFLAFSKDFSPFKRSHHGVKPQEHHYITGPPGTLAPVIPCVQLPIVVLLAIGAHKRFALERDWPHVKWAFE